MTFIFFQLNSDAAYIVLIVKILKKCYFNLYYFCKDNLKIAFAVFLTVFYILEPGKGSLRSKT